MKFVILRGRSIPAWTGGPHLYYGIPRLSVSFATGGWFRIDAFGLVVSPATIKACHRRYLIWADRPHSYSSFESRLVWMNQFYALGKNHPYDLLKR